MLLVVARVEGEGDDLCGNFFREAREALLHRTLESGSTVVVSSLVDA